MKILLQVFIFTLLVNPLMASKNVIAGKILEIDTKKPIEKCMVFLYNATEHITEMCLTDNEGKYSFENITTNIYQITVKHISYDGAQYGPFKYSEKFKKINFELTPIPFQTEDVVVSAEKIDRRLKECGFLERKAEGNGNFLSAKDIEKNELDTWRKIIPQFPMLQLKKSGNFASKRISTSLMRGNDAISIFVDGFLTETLGLGSGTNNIDSATLFNALVDVESIAGIEFYSRPTAAPLQYQKLNSTNGILLIWTK